MHQDLLACCTTSLKAREAKHYLLRPAEAGHVASKFTKPAQKLQFTLLTYIKQLERAPNPTGSNCKFRTTGLERIRMPPQERIRTVQINAQGLGGLGGGGGQPPAVHMTGLTCSHNTF